MLRTEDIKRSFFGFLFQSKLFSQPKFGSCDDTRDFSAALAEALCEGGPERVAAALAEVLGVLESEGGAVAQKLPD